MNVLDPEHYTVAWIAPLEIEARAALLMLDKRHRGRFPLSPGDDYIYEAGEICGHNVIIATLPAGQEYGTAAAAAIASQVKKFFPRLWFGLLVGVAAGLPNLERDPPRDIRLGDVLVGLPEGDHAGLIAYGLGKETGQDGFQPLRLGYALVPTEKVVRSAIGSIKINAPDDAEVFLPYYESLRDKRHSQGSFADPGQEKDVLYQVDSDGRERRVSRELRPNQERTRVWYGPIGSGDKLMKNARKRNELRDRHDIIGLEMEAAGTMNCIPVGVIRGVCDYGDEHKTKQWQPYASAMAAAYAKALLAQIPPKVAVRVEVQTMHNISEVPSMPKRRFDDHSTFDRNRRAKSPRIEDCDAQSSETLTSQTFRAQQESLNESQRKALLESLAFEQIDSRHNTIEKAYGKTCAWLLTAPEYLDWLEPSKSHEHHGFLWIKGNPGAGKSTLMKFALQNSQKTLRSNYISFFFNARGDELEKSTIGMYRSLLLQLLDKVPQLQSVFDSLGQETRYKGIPQWSLQLLMSLFEKAVQNLEQSQSSLACFIDALDECPELEIRDMISFFEALGEKAVSKGISFRVCLSSRHYPHITISRGLNLDLGQQAGHDQDIISYVKGKLRIGGGKRAEQVRSRLIEKASGVFIWVVLVVRILTEDFDHGHGHMLLRRLQDIPKDLNELFRDILTRDSRYKNELLLCIQWVLFAHQPLRQEQLYLAILIGVDSDVASNWYPEEIGDAEVKRFILSSSKGLVEVNKSQKNPKAQFIHESVREFFLNEGLASIWPELNRNFEGESHERLKNYCLGYIGIAAAGLESGQEEQCESAKRAYPLLEYAFRNVLYHADEAAAAGIVQTNFLLEFDLVGWLKLEDRIEKHVVRRHSPTTSLLYILAEYDTANLIDCHPDKLSGFEIEEGNERYGMPILAAVATNSRKSVYALLKAQANIEPLTSPLRDLCEQYDRSINMQSGVGRRFNFSRKKIPIINLLEAGDDQVFNFAAASGSLTRSINWKSREVAEQLVNAAKRGQEPTVRFLLDMGVEVNAATVIDRTPLHGAAENGQEGTTRLLLGEGANIEALTTLGWTPLYSATVDQAEVTVQILLDQGANPNAADYVGDSALHIAVIKGNNAILRLLLNRGADVKTANKDGETALHLAAKHERDASAQLLVNHGADVKAANKHGETALHLAAKHGKEVTARLLLDEGADLEATDSNGRTPLASMLSRIHELSQPETGSKAVVELLLNRGSSIGAADCDGDTPLSFAKLLRNDNAVKQLILGERARLEAAASTRIWSETIADPEYQTHWTYVESWMESSPLYLTDDNNPQV
ncbi:hypothetical protein PWT90_06074 [Aphanocladium album]|nr:hypothetical protein PWT90_06074 [Aphanocladium album]